MDTPSDPVMWTVPDQRQVVANKGGPDEVILPQEAHPLWQDKDVYGYQKRLELATAQHLERCILEIDRRAFEGVDHPVIYQGKITDTYKDYSDNLAMFRVKKLDPSYRDNYSVVEDLSAIRESLDMLRSLGTPRLEPPKIVEGKSEIVPESTETES